MMKKPEPRNDIYKLLSHNKKFREKSEEGHILMPISVKGTKAITRLILDKINKMRAEQ